MKPFSVLSPTIEFGGKTILLPVVCSPKWTKEMGHRLARARKVTCVRVDRRTSHWGHFETFMSPQCTCISQLDMARKLRISQGALSKLENGKKSVFNVDVGHLYSVFGEIAWYILTGVNKGEFERNSMNWGTAITDKSSNT